MRIECLTAEQTIEILPDLAALLQDAVNHGASVGFLPPLTTEAALNYWQEVVTALGTSYRLLLIARVNGAVTGTVQLELGSRPNGSHRAEVAKLLVHTAFRRKGIARALMTAIEQEARRAKRTTLVLDTRQGDPSEQLYLSLGYQRAGVIPEYARSANGLLDPSVFMYKLLK